MAIPYQNPPDTPLNFLKFKKNPNISLNLHEKSKRINPMNLKSLWAILSSIFVYISIFYAFNLSPSTLLSTTKFWFFISNTLVFIIAVDYASFSSSKGLDYYDEYVERSSRVEPPLDDKIFAEAKIWNEEEKPNEKIIKMVETREILRIKHNGESDPDPENRPVEKKGEYQTREEEHEIQNEEADPDPDPNPGREPGQKKGGMSGRKCARSNSDVVAGAAATGERVLQRAFSERHDFEEGDENEFSRMSDEELNGRVEEFIRRFNRQIRLQALRNSTN